MDPVHEHLRAYLRTVGALPGGEVTEDGGVLWCRISIPWPMFNGAIASPELGAVDAAGSVTASPAQAPACRGSCGCSPTRPRTSSPPRRRPARPSSTGRLRGWRRGSRTSTIQSCRPGSRSRRCTTRRATACGRRRCARSTPFRSWVSRRGSCPPSCAWNGLPWRQWIAFADGEPAAVTLLFCGGGIAGLYRVGTKASMRRCGIGRLVTLLPLKQSGEQVAGFFTTPEGEPLYRSLGFESRGWVGRWLGGFGDPDALARARGATGH